MKTHRFASHTPAAQRRLSNLGHVVEGLLLATVGVLALLSGLGMTWAAFAWPVLLLSVGVLLLILIYPRHPPSDWSAIWHDPQQQQHTIMAAAIALAGALELGGFRFAWPLAAIIIGTLFLTHKQHGEGEAVAWAVLRHRILGITVIVAGLFRLAEIATGALSFMWLWPLALLVAAVQLIIYREPDGAFEAQGGHGGHH
jgi:hypothetical protein